MICASEIITSGQVALTCEPEEAILPYMLASIPGLTDAQQRRVLGRNAIEQTLDVMLDCGAIDACTAIRGGGRVTAGDPTVIDRYGGTPIQGNPRLRKSLEDNGKGVVYDYYRKTGCFQSNHHVIVQNRILQEHPWVALELYHAFQQSKAVAYERARRAQSAYLYFPGQDFHGSN